MRPKILLLLALGSIPSLPATDPYTSLALYNGSWNVTHKNAPPEKLTNQCSRIGLYFACAQTVNGVAGNLLIFVPIPDQPGHYYLQNVGPQGRASSRGNLEIDHDKWVFTNAWDQGGSTVFYRTTNTFSGRDKITFEQAESSDNKTWTVKNSGEEIRTAAGKR